MARQKGKSKGRTPPMRPGVTRSAPGHYSVDSARDPQTQSDLPPMTKFEIAEGQRSTPVMLATTNGGEEPPELVLPTLALRHLLTVARDEDLERTFAAEDLDRLHSKARHKLYEMQRVFKEDGTDFVRGRAMLQLRDRPLGQPYTVWLDFPTRYVGMLLDASQAVEPKPPVGKPVFHWQSKKPTWVGSYSFNKVWQQAETIVSDAANAGGGIAGEVEPRVLMGASALSLMADAHLVRIEPDQVQVLPEWDDLAHLWDYAQDVVLPFERIYLDFEGPGGFAPTTEIVMGEYDPLPKRKMNLELRGAMVWRDNDGKLVVTPVAWPREWEYLKHKEGTSWSHYEVTGSVIFGTGDALQGVLNEIGYIAMRLGDSTVVSRPACVPTQMITPGNLGGFVQLPFDQDFLDGIVGRMTDGPTREIMDKEGANDAFLAGWAHMVLMAAARAMAALSILEADEVSLVDAPVEKREAYRADKRGWNIAQMVYIRPPKKYLNANAPSGEEAHYSHRFWVRAHTKHFSIGTRVADARPDLCKPCHRCGVCRRVKQPAFIKGPPDKPLVPKSLAIKRDERVTHIPVDVDREAM